MKLIVQYQKIDVIIGFILAIPLLYFYYKAIGETPSLFNVILTAAMIAFILFIKNVLIQYSLMVYQAQNA